MDGDLNEIQNFYQWSLMTFWNSNNAKTIKYVYIWTVRVEQKSSENISAQMIIIKHLCFNYLKLNNLYNVTTLYKFGNKL